MTVERAIGGDRMEATVMALVILVVAAGVAAAGRASRGAPPVPAQQQANARRKREVVIDLVAAVDSPAVSRIVDTVARTTFAAEEEVDEVVVIDRHGTVLGRRDRTVSRPLAPAPPDLTSPAAPRRAHVPSPVGAPTPSPVSLGEAPDVPPRRLLDRYDLPPAVREAVADPDDPLALVAAIVSVAGRPVEHDAGMLRSQDHFLTVIGSTFGRPAIPRILNDVYLAFLGSGARHGLVVSFDHLDHVEVERRELLAPAFRHVGPDAIQQMADAVWLGGDPLAFVTTAATGRTRG